MSNTNQVTEVSQATFSPWMALWFAILASIFVDAMILWGLVEMSSALRIAATSGAMALLAISIVFSFMKLREISEKPSLKVISSNQNDHSSIR